MELGQALGIHAEASRFRDEALWESHEPLWLTEDLCSAAT
jgi:hypothetical protein